MGGGGGVLSPLAAPFYRLEGAWVGLKQTASSVARRAAAEWSMVYNYCIDS